MVVPGQRCLGGETGDLDAAIGHHQQALRRQREVVQPADLTRVKRERGFPGDPTDPRRHPDRRGRRELAERVGAVERLLGEEGDAIGAPGRENAREPVVVETAGAIGGVEDGERLRVILGENDQDDGIAGGAVGPGPRLGTGVLAQQAVRDVAIGDDRSGDQGRHEFRLPPRAFGRGGVTPASVILVRRRCRSRSARGRPAISGARAEAPAPGVRPTSATRIRCANAQVSDR
jgi:hypothetical protein